MSSKYFWTIDKDHIEGTADGLSCNFMLDTFHPLGEQFRMFDDDEELYYEGTIWGDYDGFEPLDDFGMPSAGCTNIQYQNDKGEWKWL